MTKHTQTIGIYLLFKLPISNLRKSINRLKPVSIALVAPIKKIIRKKQY